MLPRRFLPRRLPLLLCALALLALPPWVLVWARAARSEPRLAPAASGDARMRVAASPTAVAMTVMFGIQAMHAYIQFGWLPQIYRDAGLSATIHFRERDEDVALKGQRCTKCGAVQFPIQRVCEGRATSALAASTAALPPPAASGQDAVRTVATTA